MADAIVLKDEVEQLPSGHWIRRTWTRDARTGFMRAIVRLASAEEVREIGAMQAAGGKSTATASEFTEVKCPHCGETLYRLGPLAPEVLGVLPGGPPLLDDAGGYYKTCPHCRKRVDMEQVSTQVGTGFRVAGT